MDRRVGRMGIALVLFLLISSLGVQFVLAGHHPHAHYASSDSDGQVVPPRNGTTVVTTQNGENTHLGTLIAFGPDGRVRHYEDRHSSYWDVDPSPAGRSTITYVATEKLDGRQCQGVVASYYCRLNVLEQLNLSTGERTRLYEHRADHADDRWHDVDRLNATHFVVAAMGDDAVFVVNVSSGIRTWTWTAESYFNRTAGGNYNGDWSHINDVEVLPDGRIMVSARNMDRVIFLERGGDGGVITEQTLGREDAFEVMREQHNPDYIPASNGGPGVVVADSENNRIVEYQRRNGSWNRTWYWRDAELQWPRDADRLPSGHTLVTDTVGDRVLEIDRQGEVVWSVPVDKGYEAERLWTGDESTGGPSATAANLTAKGVGLTVPGRKGSLEHAFRRVIPVKIQNALLGYFFPWWFGLSELLQLFGVGAISLSWLGLEARWRKDRLRRYVLQITDSHDVVWRSAGLILALLGVAGALAFLAVFL